ncbi:oligopeptide/dipeptide ABC transporter ATP-binding protein [Rhizobium sp. RU36D]|uniref:ABC transporter ATP-binding protein n=1 Tax=Rhizobium sp. RU36D TaxID=1907415 RepID=UPI0009D88832|nr:oligopeptide/dipeptide ABC transporter ATP-binding protein [Rhizobium sp. RU36D]SMC93689.1 peptide/nickel transport system ATP-binding protein [Rhizobium sp. RU36D]
MTAFVDVTHLGRSFDVSKPWLNRVIERLPRRTLLAVSDVSFQIEEGAVYALVGESGSGKSTIGRMLAGLMPPSEGTVKVGGADLHADPAIRRDAGIQMIFQDPYASLNPRWRVRRIICEPVVVKGGTTEGLAERLLEQVGLSAEDADKFPHEFSGGQRQRICIARALAAKPRLIICDEPTSALDVSVQAQVLNLMSDLRDELGLTYMFISHDLTVVRHMADRIGVLYLGRLMEEATPAQLFAQPRHPYTQMLLAAAPLMDGRTRDIDLPRGEVPDPISPPPGCAFHPRCPFAVDLCRKQRPELRDFAGTRVACHRAEDIASESAA